MKCLRVALSLSTVQPVFQLELSLHDDRFHPSMVLTRSLEPRGVLTIAFTEGGLKFFMLAHPRLELDPLWKCLQRLAQSNFNRSMVARLPPKGRIEGTGSGVVGVPEKSVTCRSLCLKRLRKLESRLAKRAPIGSLREGSAKMETTTSWHLVPLLSPHHNLTMRRRRRRVISEEGQGH